MRALMRLRAWLGVALAAGLAGLGPAWGCSASGKSTGSGSTESGLGGGSQGCGFCVENRWVGCDEQGLPLPEQDCEPQVCAPGLGCSPCVPGNTVCVGNDVHTCDDQGQPGGLDHSCDPAKGEICDDGECKPECQVADESP